MRHPYSEALLASVPKVDQDPDERLLQHPRPAARPVPDHHQLPVRAALPVRHRPVPGRGAAARRRGIEHRPGRGPPLRLLPPGGSQRRAADPGHHRRPPRASRGRQRPARLIGTRPKSSPVEHLVKEFPVMAGGVFRHQVGTRQGGLRRVASPSAGARPSGWSASRAAARPPSGGSWWPSSDPTSGTIRFEGDEVNRLHGAALRHRRRDLQLMFQDPYASLDPRMRVGSIIREPLKVQRVGDAPRADGRVRNCSTRSGSARRRSTATRTSSREASASGSAWPGRWRSIPS